jgi:outer membrane receptor protein involved in Fe transport
VCNGTASSLGATTPYSYVDTKNTPDPADDETYTGLAACSLSQPLMDEAKQIAIADDFEEAPSRSQFSPRIGLQFPLTEGSAVFFNFGRFAQNPALYDLYRGTGVGLADEGTPDGVSLQTPSGRRPLIGNPQLETEVATAYEVGYVSEFRTNYSIRATAFNKNQNGLTGIGEGGLLSDGTRVNDPGATYKTASPNYMVLLNGDFQTARGIELQLRRRVTNFWGFDINYSFSRVVTNAAPPELESQKRDEGDLPARTRIRSETDQPHVFNGVLRFQTDSRTPAIPYVGTWLRHASAAATFRVASGLPYTPDISGVRRERASKDWLVGNARLGAFATVSNLLDRRNCVQVFASTGQCESGQGTSGRLEKARIGASYGSTGTYSQAFDRPDYRVSPRAISGGLRLSF